MGSLWSSCADLPLFSLFNKKSNLENTSTKNADIEAEVPAPINHRTEQPAYNSYTSVPLEVSSKDLPEIQITPASLERVPHINNILELKNITSEDEIKNYSESTLKMLLEKYSDARTLEESDKNDLIAQVIQLWRQSKDEFQNEADGSTGKYLHDGSITIESGNYFEIVNEVTTEGETDGNPVGKIDAESEVKSVEDHSESDRQQKETNETGKQLTSVKLCIKCNTAATDCVFLECGHLATCYECGQELRYCPVCNNNISKTIKIFKG